MKFTDGYWRHLPGVTVLRPRAVAEVVVGDDTLIVHASTGPVTSRAATLDAALVAVSFDSPMDDVIRVRIEHHRRRRRPGSVVRASPTRAADVTVVGAEGADDGVATFRAGGLTARVSTRRAVARRLRGGWSGADVVDRPVGGRGHRCGG